MVPLILGNPQIVRERERQRDTHGGQRDAGGESEKAEECVCVRGREGLGFRRVCKRRSTADWKVEKSRARTLEIRPCEEPPTALDSVNFRGNCYCKRR